MFLFATSNFLRPSSGKILPNFKNGSLPDILLEQDDGAYKQDILGLLPLVAIMLIAVGYHIGLNPIIWAYTGMFLYKIGKFFRGLLPFKNIYICIYICIYIYMIHF